VQNGKEIWGMFREWFQKQTRSIRRHARVVATAVTPIRPGRPHTLPGELVVSLTSYPKRFGTLHLTLRSLMSQDMKPDRLILWIAGADVAQVPERVMRLRDYGLEIRECDDLRSYKKLIPTLLLYPNAFILTADDDVFYPHVWLRRFVEAYRGPHEVLCQRARRVLITEAGPLPYSEWRVVQGADAGEDIMPTGVAGVLYPPGSLPQETTNAAEFMRLCPTADDLWFYWMTHRAGCSHRVIRPAGEFMTWPKAQNVALWRLNIGNGGNDRQVAALFEAYGRPAALANRACQSIA
jgi:hypothetical protein